VQLASPSVVTVSYEGQESCQRGQKSVFVIDTGEPTNIDNINVSVSRESAESTHLHVTCYAGVLKTREWKRGQIARVKIERVECVSWRGRGVKG